MNGAEIIGANGAALGCAVAVLWWRMRTVEKTLHGLPCHGRATCPEEVLTDAP
jgi:hypothetical protein